MNLVEQAKQRTLETALEAKKIQDALDAWETVGKNFFDEYVEKADRDEFLDGTQKMRNALANKMFRSVANNAMFFEDCKGMKDLFVDRIEKFKSGKYSLIHFLQTWGRFPHSWPTEEEKQFQKEFNELHETK